MTLQWPCSNLAVTKHNSLWLVITCHCQLQPPTCSPSSAGVTGWVTANCRKLALLLKNEVPGNGMYILANASNAYQLLLLLVATDCFFFVLITEGLSQCRPRVSPFCDYWVQYIFEKYYRIRIRKPFFRVVFLFYFNEYYWWTNWRGVKMCDFSPGWRSSITSRNTVECIKCR